MRTNIEIDDKLMKDALKATGAKTKREAVELGLKLLVQLRAQEKARDLKGKITWEEVSVASRFHPASPPISHQEGLDASFLNSHVAHPA
ncbi:MAG TPA: type II toxin-antitoxin system VapB family antitoxin [Burkholderiaceae bacterium]|nr:type II toxin-antitoxin system VapB family antitoxin [Burkholderiaceae bacterium]